MTPNATRWIGLLMLTTSIVLSAVGQLFMKVGMQGLHETAAVATASRLALATLEQPVLWIGGGLLAYAVSMLAWLAVLVRYPLSYAYPVLSLSYVLVYVGATQWSRLMEAATLERTAGTLLILVGVGLVSLTGDRGAPHDGERVEDATHASDR